MTYKILVFSNHHTCYVSYRKYSVSETIHWLCSKTRENYHKQAPLISSGHCTQIWEKVKFMLENWNHTLNLENIMDYRNLSRSNYSASELKMHRTPTPSNTTWDINAQALGILHVLKGL